MTLDEIDKSELIYESYRIDGIDASQCRSIFLDWALKLPAEADQNSAIQMMIDTYVVKSPGHPMNTVLQDALGTPDQKGRRGGRAGRMREEG